MAEETARSTRKATIGKFVRLAVTLAALAYVVTQITWRDQLRLPSGEVLNGWQVEETIAGLSESVFKSDKGSTHAIPPATDDASVAHPFTPGFITLLSGVDILTLGFFFALYPITILVASVRWRSLLTAHGLQTPYATTLRLTWLGQFANNVFIGANGGDLLKAWSISRRTPNMRMAAVMTVLLDRIIGLFSFMLLGGVAILFMADHPALVRPSRMVLVSLVAVGIFGSAYFSSRFRDIIRFGQILQRLPFSGKLVQLDQSVFHFRNHPGVLAQCIGYSLAVQLLSVVCIWGISRSLGMQISFGYFLLFLPLIFTAGAVAPSIAGLGVLEGLFQQFFSLPGVGATPSSAVALCILYRIMTLVTSLPGAAPAYRELSSSPEAAPSAVPISAEPEPTRAAA